MPKTFVFGRSRRHKAKPRGRHALQTQSLAEINEPVRDVAVTQTQTQTAEDHHAIIVTDNVDEPIIEQGSVELDTSRAEEKIAAFAHLGSTPVHDAETWNFIASIPFLTSLIGAMVCRFCYSSSLHLSPSESKGLARKFSLYCEDCEETIWSECTSSLVNGRRHEINYRAVLATKETGISLQSVKNFFNIMNMPSPMHHKTYTEISAEIHTAAVGAAEDCMKMSADLIKERHSAGLYACDIVSPSGVQVATTSFDGTWQKRGHSSHNGVGIVIDVDSGFVLDTHVVCNYCRVCEKGPKTGSSDFHA